MGSTSDIIIDENLKKITYLPQVILSSNVLNNMCTENVFNDICVCLKSAHNPKYIAYIFFTPFLMVISLFSRRFFLYVSMVSI